MNVEEAKERLSCYRPGIDDPADEVFAPALSVAEHDPELAQWLKDQQEFDTALRGHLKKTEVPQGLLLHLQGNAGKAVPDFSDLSEEKANASAGDQVQGKIVNATFWTRVAAAAAIVVLGFFALNSLNFPASAVESFRGDMVKMANAGFHLDHKSMNMSEVRDWLVSHESPVYDECRPCIGLKKGVGCRKFTWNDNAVSVVCFEKETGKVVHMFVIARTALGDREMSISQVPLKQLQGLETGGWVDGKNFYLLVGAKDDVVVRDLL